MGLLIALVFFGAAILGGWLWSLVILMAIYFGNREFKALMGNIGIQPSQAIILASTAAMVVCAHFNESQFLSPILTLSIIASFFRLIFRNPRAHISDIGGTLIVIFYMVYMPVFFILLRHLGNTPGHSAWQQPGLHYLLMTLAVICISDIAAYYVGKTFGKHPLYPAISPKKTLEGAIGGLIAGIVLGMGTTLLWSFPLMHAVILSVLLVIVGQLGDLAESMMKRDVGMKDSGGLLASHGGLLDRVDSYIFSGVVSYYYIYWFVLHEGLAPTVLNGLKHVHFF